MALVLNEEQRLLKDSAREFLQSNSPVEAFRKLRDEKDATGYSQDIWQQMVELGWTGIAIPESYGGLDFGFSGLGTIFEESGRTLAASPLFSTVVLGASAIEFAGSEEQKQELLGEVAAGSLTLALALEEGTHHAPTNIALTAEKSGDSYTLNGTKTFVLDGHSTDKLVVVARTSGQAGDTDGISLFIVDRETAGININRTINMDSRNAARIEFSNVSVPASQLLGEEGKSFDALDKTLDRGRAILAAEMLGGCLEMFQRTCEYLKEREQFDVKIGTFQALKHRASIMFTEIELCKSVVLAALEAVDNKADNLNEITSLAKARLCDTFQLVTNEATQMHGGIGVTDELDIGLFLKRARASMLLLGDASFHRNRYANIKGF